MARYPGATWRPLPTTSYYPGRRSAHLGLILHVQQGANSPWGWFCNPAAQASSTFWVATDGTVEQYMEAGTDASWAQSAGNYQYDSVETEGLDSEPLTDAQIAALAALCAWENATFGMPLVAIDTPGASGFGWHGMGGAAWGGHYGCPGDIRKAQRPQILGASTVSNVLSSLPTIAGAPGSLTTTTPEDDMTAQFETDVRAQLALDAQRDTSFETDVRGDLANKQTEWEAFQAKYDALDRDLRADLLNKGAQISALTATVNALSGLLGQQQGLDVAAVKQAVTDAIAAGVHVTVSAG